MSSVGQDGKNPPDRPATSRPWFQNREKCANCFVDSENVTIFASVKSLPDVYLEQIVRIERGQSWFLQG